MKVSVLRTPGMERTLSLSSASRWSSSSHTTSIRRSNEPLTHDDVVDLGDRGDVVGDRAQVALDLQADHRLAAEARASSGSVTATICTTPDSIEPLHPLAHRGLGEPDRGGELRVREPAVLLELLDDRLVDVVDDDGALGAGALAAPSARGMRLLRRSRRVSPGRPRGKGFRRRRARSADSAVQGQPGYGSTEPVSRRSSASASSAGSVRTRWSPSPASQPWLRRCRSSSASKRLSATTSRASNAVAQRVDAEPHRVDRAEPGVGATSTTTSRADARGRGRRCRRRRRAATAGPPAPSTNVIAVGGRAGAISRDEVGDRERREAERVGGHRRRHRRPGTSGGAGRRSRRLAARRGRGSRRRSCPSSSGAYDCAGLRAATVTPSRAQDVERGAAPTRSCRPRCRCR